MQTADEVVPRARKEINLSEKDIARFWSKVDKNGPLPDQTNPHYKGLDQCWLWMASRDTGGYGQLSVGGRLVKTSRIAWTLANGQIPHDGSYHGVCVLHKCDVKTCCRSDHLFLGTNADNVLDKENKGRGNQPRGDRHGSRTKPERVPRGDAHYARLHPERVARGDRSRSRLYPESLLRGDAHPARTHPERLARGDRHGSRTHPERVLRGEANGSAKLTAAQVLEIRALYATGKMTKAFIAAQFGMSQSSIGGIINHKKWKHVP